MRRSTIAVLVFLFACGTGQSSDPVAPPELVIHTAAGDVVLEVEVAYTDPERATGLMGRDRLAPIDGMAFVFEGPAESGFWMKDTLIPLSIAFWDERGRIVAILDMDPCEANTCPIYRPGVPYVGAVEVSQGLFHLRGVEVGDRVELFVANA